MFPKLQIATLLIGLTAFGSVVADCGYQETKENDSRIEFDVVLPDDSGGYLKVTIPKIDGRSPGYALVSFLVGDESQGRNGGKTHLRLEDEGSSYSAIVEYFHSNSSLKIRIEASYSFGFDCQDIIANEWKHNQSVQAD